MNDKRKKYTYFLRCGILCAAAAVCSLSLSSCLLDDLFVDDENWNESWWENPGIGGQVPDEAYDDEDDGWSNDDGEDNWFDDEDWTPDFSMDDDRFTWWNALDDSWSRDDWDLVEDGLWAIFDEETGLVYAYDEDSQSFAAMDPASEDVYLLDMDSGEWVPAE